jgi:hypothetical protein
MSRLGIQTGSNPNDGQGDPLRIAMGKINSNFTEIYNSFGDGFSLISYASTAGILTLARNLTGSPRINVSGVLSTWHHNHRTFRSQKYNINRSQSQLPNLLEMDLNSLM